MFSGLTQTLKLPDPWQHSAVSHLRAGSDVIVSAPTGAGKTFIFELIAKAGHHKRQLVYTVPTRALANDKQAEWTEAGWNVGLATGDLALNVHAPVLVATLETQIERLISGDGPALLVIDEYQMIADSSRGSHYEGAIILTPPNTQLLLLSGSVENPNDLAEWMRRLGRQVEVISTHNRPVPLEDFPLDYHQPRFKNIENRWAKLATAALLADLAPLLIFAPRRKDAESIAAKIATHLPPGEPLSLTHEQRILAGKDIASMLEKRVAFHHSGISYPLRAGLIEPLAKAGQLRVIVSTMGLAAGINFSVRSVHVSGTTFHDGVSEQQLSADELLQMFGRAGRRGLDERGYVLTTRDSPTLNDSRPVRLRRGNKLSWPLFLRIMYRAAQDGRDPFIAATEFTTKLFAKTPPDLGLTPQQTATPQTTTALFGLKATQRELLNSQGHWEPITKPVTQTVPLSQTHLANDTFQGPTLSSTRYLSTLFPTLGRITKLPGDQKIYGREIALGRPSVPDPTGEIGLQTIALSLRKLLQIPRHIESLTPEKLHLVALPKLDAQLPNATFFGMTTRGDTLWATYDFSNLPVEATQDSHGHWLVTPQFRTLERQVDTEIHQPSTSHHKPSSGSAIYAWRTLGLIESDGTPTQRGIIFSFFQQGEGLAIAAALEDESYPIDELLPHLANLRGNTHIDLPIANPSERLSAICRATYGFVNHTGYLEAGLPLAYGEATAELLGLSSSLILSPSSFQNGDLARAYTEWLSLLRHLSHSPDHPWTRWTQLKSQSAALLQSHLANSSHTLHPKLPPLTPKQKHERPLHYLLRKHA
ncbi:DEAD/DEAH box helicase [Phragmitibacter flavus]|uniref:DEAD/DEAH box helicase n=1 Tax=Phragmitibacter flavus TaxID=2576071 RepID=A0A5R8KDK6_9BACT|nr:DEAD/DEAH box helicase [Phragmitibacter flavus]TLD70005.1 DEAD/DEAH box helicase [Phragmitibacter flavus]